MTLFPAIGCQNVSPPDGAWIKRDGNNLALQCNKTGETWYLTCKDDEWIGEYGNCSGKQIKAAARGSKNFLQRGIPLFPFWSK